MKFQVEVNITNNNHALQVLDDVWLEMSFLNIVKNFVSCDVAFNFVICDGTYTSMHTLFCDKGVGNSCFSIKKCLTCSNYLSWNVNSMCVITTYY